MSVFTVYARLTPTSQKGCNRELEYVSGFEFLDVLQVLLWRFMEGKVSCNGVSLY